MSWQSEASNQITLHNQSDTELTAIEYVFNVTVRNPNYAQEALTWHFATYQSEAALDDDLIDEAYMTGFPVNSRLPSVFMEALPAGQQNAGSNATWIVWFELVNELLSGDSLVLIGPQEYEFDILKECRNVVSSLAAPSCSGNVLLVSHVGVNDALLPNLGGTDRTVAVLGVRCDSPKHETCDKRGAVVALLKREPAGHSRSAGGTVFQHHRLETVRAVTRHPSAYFTWCGTCLLRARGNWADDLLCHPVRCLTKGATTVVVACET